MRFLIALLFVTLASPAVAGYHVAAPVVAVVGKSPAAILGGGAVACGIGIGVVAVAVVWCGLNQPKRNLRRDTWTDGRSNFYPSYKPRKYGCLFKRPRHATKQTGVLSK